jgi:hypothetical protein
MQTDGSWPQPRSLGHTETVDGSAVFLWKIYLHVCIHVCLTNPWKAGADYSQNSEIDLAHFNH